MLSCARKVIGGFCIFSSVQRPVLVVQRQFCTALAFILRRPNMDKRMSRLKQASKGSLHIQSAEAVEQQMAIYNKKQNLRQAIDTMNNARLLGIVPSAKCFDTLLYLCNLHGQHKELDRWYMERQKHYDGIGWGTLMSLVRSFCDRGQWKAAMMLLRNQMKENKLYHTRFYNPIIECAAEAGQTDVAFQLFKEKIELSVSVFHKGSLLIPDSTMLAALIRCCYKEASKSPGESVMETCHTSRVMEVFKYFQDTGAPLPMLVLDAASDWFIHGSVNTWRWRASTVDKEGVCSACGSSLARGEDKISVEFDRLGEEILNRFSSGQQPQVLNQKDSVQFGRFQNFVKSQGPFDVIIDGMNVGLSATDRRKPTFVNAKELRDLVIQFTQKGKTVLVALQSAALPDIDNSAEYIAELKDLCFVNITSHKWDDLYILYAAAFSGMQSVQVVTNDMLKDHHVLFGLDLKWTYLKWTRLNCIGFEIDKEKSQISLCEKLFDPVVQGTDDSWHFPAEDGSWRCVRKQLSRE